MELAVTTQRNEAEDERAMLILRFAKEGYTPAEIRSFTNERLELIQAVINRHLPKSEGDA